MADARFDFATNINDVRRTIVAGLDKLVTDMNAAGSRLGSVEFGAGLGRGLTQRLGAVREEVRAAIRSLQTELESGTITRGQFASQSSQIVGTGLRQAQFAASTLDPKVLEAHGADINRALLNLARTLQDDTKGIGGAISSVIRAFEKQVIKAEGVQPTGRTRLVYRGESTDATPSYDAGDGRDVRGRAFTEDIEQAKQYAGELGRVIALEMTEADIANARRRAARNNTEGLVVTQGQARQAAEFREVPDALGAKTANDAIRRRWDVVLGDGADAVDEQAGTARTAARAARNLADAEHRLEMSIGEAVAAVEANARRMAGTTAADRVLGPRRMGGGEQAPFYLGQDDEGKGIYARVLRVQEKYDKEGNLVQEADEYLARIVDAERVSALDAARAAAIRKEIISALEQQARIIRQQAAEDARSARQAETDARRVREEHKQAYQTAMGNIVGQGLTDQEDGFKRLRSGFVQVPTNVASSGFVKRTTTGYDEVKSIRDLNEAREALAATLKAEASAANRTQPVGLGRAFMTGVGGRGFNPDEKMKLDPQLMVENMMHTIGAQIRYAAGGFAIYTAVRGLADLKQQYLDYVDSLTNFNVALGYGVHEGQGYVQTLQQISRASGSNVGEALDVAARGVRAFGEAGNEAAKGFNEDVAARMVNAATQLAVIADKPLGDAAGDIISIANAFGIASQNLTQVTDAIAAAKQIGGDPSQIAQGLSSWGQAAQEAGFNLKEGAAAISLVQARTDESGSAAATRLSRITGIFGTGGNQAFLSGLGIDVTQSVEKQIAALSVVYNKASSSEQAMIRSRLGGTANLRELLPLLDAENQKLLQTARNADIAGRGQAEYNRRTTDLAGTLKKISSDIKDIEVNLVNTGIFDPLIIGVKALEPLLHVLADFIGILDRVAGVIPQPLRGLMATVIELGLLLKVIKAIRDSGGIGDIAGKGAQRVREFGNPGLAAQNAAAKAASEAPAASGARFTAGASGIDDAAAQAATAAAARTTAETQMTEEVKRSTIKRAFTENVGGIRVSTAMGMVADGVIAAGTGLVTAIREAGIRTQLASVAAEAKGFFNSFAGLLTLASIGVESAMYAFQAGMRINKALDQGTKAMGEGAVLSTATPDDIAKAADDLRTAADNLKQSSGGFWGAINNGLRGDPTGAAAHDAERRADELDAYKKQLDDLAKKAANSSFDATSAIDVSTPEGITNGLKLLADTGRDAETQFNALIGALDRLQVSTDGATRRLTATELKKFAVNLGDRMRDEVDFQIEQAQASVGVGRTFLDVAVSPLRKIGNIFSPGAPFKSTEQRRADALEHVDRNKLAKDAQDAAQQFIDEGGDITTPAGQAELQKILAKKVADDLKNVPKKYRDGILKGLGLDIKNSLTPLLNVADPSADLDTLLREGIPVAQNFAAKRGIQANLNGDPSGSALVEAQTYVSQLQTLRANAVAHGATKEKLEAIDLEIQKAQIALNAATASHIDAMGQLALSLMSPFDKGGRLQQQLGTLNQELAVTTDADARAALQGKIADTQNQIAQQAVTDANAARSAGAQTGNQTDAALVAWQNAYATWQFIANSGGTGEDIANAVKAANDAQFAYVSKTIQDANSARMASIDPRRVITRAIAELKGMQDTLAHTTDPGERSALIDQMNQKQLEINNDFVAWRHALARADLDPRDTVGNAQEDLNHARDVLAQQIPGTAAYADAYRDVQEKKIALAKANIDLSNARLSANTFPGAALEQARTGLEQAINNMKDDLRGTQEWYQDLAALHQQQIAYDAAVRDAADTAYRLGIDITDPVATSLADLRKANQKLRDDRRNGAPEDQINQDLLEQRTAQNNAEKTAFEQRMHDMQTADQLGQISHLAYLQYLQHEHDRLTAVKNRTRQQQDELNEIDQALQGANQQLSGQFNLGDIKVPSVYEMRRQLGSSAASVVDASTVNNNVTINGTDIQTVLNYIASILGSSAINARTPTANRKAA